jgi:hypothetical protein
MLLFLRGTHFNSSAHLLFLAARHPLSLSWEGPLVLFWAVTLLLISAHVGWEEANSTLWPRLFNYSTPLDHMIGSESFAQKTETGYPVKCEFQLSNYGFFFLILSTSQMLQGTYLHSKIICLFDIQI